VACFFRKIPFRTGSSYEDRIHGGVIATPLDGAMVHALFATGVVGVTVELTIRYLHSVQLGPPVEVTGWVESKRLGIYLCAAEIRQAGNLAVKAMAKFMALTAASAAS
jgi:acyl-coenzyme A thioesterase PaaI-like protein